MSKNRWVPVIILFLVLYAGCATVKPLDPQLDPLGGEAEIRAVFVGVWEGEHLEDGKKVRSWVQRRSQDGTYIIQFLLHTEEGAVHTMRKGKWWIKAGRFYEISPSTMQEPDVYEYEVVSEDEIRFKSVTRPYSFTDKRMKNADMPRFM